MKELSENMFITADDRRDIELQVAQIRKEIAWARVDVRKLKYGDE